MPLSKSKTEAEAKSGVKRTFRNPLWAWIRRHSATESHVQHVQSSLTTTKRPVKATWDHLFPSRKASLSSTGHNTGVAAASEGGSPETDR